MKKIEMMTLLSVVMAFLISPVFADTKRDYNSHNTHDHKEMSKMMEQSGSHDGHKIEHNSDDYVLRITSKD